jgi:hypothetical protein
LELAQRKKQASGGHSIEGTDSEEREIDRELEGEVVSESDSPSSRRHHHRRTVATTRSRPRHGNKGAEDNDPSDDEGDAEDSPVEDWEKVTGPLPKDGKIAAMRLGKSVRWGAAQIASKYDKSIRQIMIQAGLAVRSSRGANIFNMYKEWYAHEHPIQPNGTYC